MSKFNNIVPVPLGEVRRLDGKLDAAMKPGTLVTAIGNFAGGSSTHAQSDYPNVVFTANTVGNNSGLMIVMEQEDLINMEVSDEYKKDSHARGHVLKAGEECTVILDEAAKVSSGDLLATAAAGRATPVGEAGVAVFSAIETCAADATDDALRILVRVL